MKEKVKFSVSLDAALGEALRERADVEDAQISAVVSRALEEYLSRRRVISDGLRAMEEYQKEFGRFAEEDLAAADAWIDDILGTSEEERRSA